MSKHDDDDEVEVPDFGESADKFQRMRIFQELGGDDKASIVEIINLMSEALKKPSDELLEKIYGKIDRFQDDHKGGRFSSAPPIRKKFDRLVEIWKGNMEMVPQVPPHEAISELGKQFETWWKDSGAKERAEKPEVEKVEKVLRMLSAQASLVKKGRDGITEFTNPFLDITRAIDDLANLERSPNHRGFRRLASKWHEVVEKHDFDDETDPLDD